jgi:hypothetical protein
MQIDNLAAAQDLSDRLEATLPFQVRAHKELLTIMRSQDAYATPATVFTVDTVTYAGDTGGITCGLEPVVGQVKPKEKFVTPITHLKFDPTHPLLAEIEAYQHNRTQRLKLQDQKGFAAEILSQHPSAKRPSVKGFAKGFAK